MITILNLHKCVSLFLTEKDGSAYAKVIDPRKGVEEPWY
jgi:hypothetical protein